tara:strand:- start:6549 stop:7319 length:771 start_codon:yes stop_codon:yes gene_type:complete
MSTHTVPYSKDRINICIEKWRSGEATFLEERELSRAIDFRVRYILNKVRVPDGYELDDLVSVGTIAAFECAERWVPEQGDFMSFSFARIRGAIHDYLRKMDSVSRPLRVMIGKVNEASRRVSQKLGREPTVNDICKELDVPREDVLAAIMASRTRESISIHNPVEHNSLGDAEVIDFLIDKDDQFNSLDLSSDLQTGLNRLPERSRMILFDFYMRDMSQRDIANRHGLTEARISQIRQTSLESLKGFLGELMDTDS